jgi:hypothetical protein
VKGAAAALAGLLLFVGAAELVLRVSGFNAPIWFGPDERLGWSMRPGVEGWYTKEGRAYVRVNRAGFRDVDHALEKPARTYRIAFIGDSVVEALQVDLEDAFWRRLPEELRGCPALAGRQVEVMGFGVAGYGTAQQYLLLQSTAIKYRPDAVVLAFAPNDVINNSMRLEPESERPFFVPQGEGLRLDGSFTKSSAFAQRSSPLFEAYRASSDWLRLVQLVQAARNGVQVWRQAGVAHAAPGAKVVAGIEPTTRIELFAPPRDAALEEAWTVTERLAALMHRYSARHGVRFSMLVLTHSAQVHPDATTRASLEQALGVKDLFYIERRMEALGRREGFPVITLAPELQERASAGKMYFHGFENYGLGWGHWNPRGHRTAAQVIAPRLCAAL